MTMKRLAAIGDRLLNRLVPQDTAKADTCTTETKCVWDGGNCNFIGYRTKRKRTVCAESTGGPSYGPWRNDGCCG